MSANVATCTNTERDVCIAQNVDDTFIEEVN